MLVSDDYRVDFEQLDPHAIYAPDHPARLVAHAQGHETLAEVARAGYEISLSLRPRVDPGCKIPRLGTAVQSERNRPERRPARTTSRFLPLRSRASWGPLHLQKADRAGLAFNLDRCEVALALDVLRSFGGGTDEMGHYNPSVFDYLAWWYYHTQRPYLRPDSRSSKARADHLRWWVEWADEGDCPRVRRLIERVAAYRGPQWYWMEPLLRLAIRYKTPQIAEARLRHTMWRAREIMLERFGGGYPTWWDAAHGIAQTSRVGRAAHIAAARLVASGYSSVVDEIETYRQARALLANWPSERMPTAQEDDVRRYVQRWYDAARPKEGATPWVCVSHVTAEKARAALREKRGTRPWRHDRILTKWTTPAGIIVVAVMGYSWDAQARCTPWGCGVMIGDL